MAEQLNRYADRVRAKSFGSVAENYDRYRPSYPPALFDDLAALGPESVLDIGCGTGKAAVLLAARGLPVLGVEIDERMAELARSHGIDVEVGAFETWDDAGRTFDLIVCAQAWHWIDPELGMAKAARLLNPGGTLAILFSGDQVREPLASRIDAVYRAHVPELMVRIDEIKAKHKDKPLYVDSLSGSGLFDSVDVVNYPSERTDTAAHWVGMVATHSDYVTMDVARREALLADALAAIDEHGGVVANDVLTYLVRARRASGAVRD